MLLSLAACSLLALVLDGSTPVCTQAAAARRAATPAMNVFDIDPTTYNPEKGGLSQTIANTLRSPRPEGSHSTGYRFMPLSTVSKDSAPALVCLAGFFPGLSTDDLLRPQPLPFPPPGTWNYHVLTGEACSSGVVCLPGSALLDSHPDTVGVVCASTALGIEFPDRSEHEVIALIDRGDVATLDRREFDNQAFYAFGDEEGRVQIRWIAEVPAGWRILGRLLYAQVTRPHDDDCH